MTETDRTGGGSCSLININADFRQCTTTDGTDVEHYAMLAWTAPAHPVAPLPENMGVLIPSKPAWFNDPASQAILPDGMQRGDTCGLHAVNTILSSFASLRGHQRPCITKTDFESYALQRNLGDHAHNLVQPDGSNYALAVLHANLQRHAISVPYDAK